MNFTDSLTENHLFRRLYHRGRRSVQPSLVLYAMPNGTGRSRLGLTATPKVGKAVVRNRIKRRLREAYRLNEGQFRPGMDLVIVARSRARYVDFSLLTQQLLEAAASCRTLRR